MNAIEERGRMCVGLRKKIQWLSRLARYEHFWPSQGITSQAPMASLAISMLLGLADCDSKRELALFSEPWKISRDLSSCFWHFETQYITFPDPQSPLSFYFLCVSDTTFFFEQNSEWIIKMVLVSFSLLSLSWDATTKLCTPSFPIR